MAHGLLATAIPKAQQYACETVTAFRELILGKLTVRRAELVMEQGRLKDQITRAQHKLDRLLDAMLEGALPRSDYKAKSAELRLDLTAAREGLVQLKMDDVDVEGGMDLASELLSNLAKTTDCV